MTREKAHTFLLQLLPDKRLNFSEHEAIRVAIEALYSGHWEVANVASSVEYYKCSACGCVNADKTDYCPYCGAEMEGGE